MKKNNLMNNNALLLLLFFHAVLIPSQLSLFGIITSIIWSVLILLALPRLLYIIDRLRIHREVSAAIVLFLGIVFAIMFGLIERAFFYRVDSDVTTGLALFVFLTVLLGRIENVYESQELSSSYQHILLTIMIVTSTILGKFYIMNDVAYMLNLKGWIELKVWSFWQDLPGRLLVTTFFILLWTIILSLIQRVGRGKNESR